MTKRALLLLLLVSPLLAAPETLQAKVDRLARPYVEAERVVGMVIAVVDEVNGDVLISGFGKLTPGGAGEPDANTVYEIGSFSKVFTGVLLALLEQDGKVRFDQPLAELLPKSVKVPAHGDRRITLVDLATHTSGLPRMPNNFAPKDTTNPYVDYSVAQMYDFLSGHTLARAPGAVYAYSNYGMGLLGHTLARKAGQSYEDLLKARITGMLGMTSTAIALTDDMKKRLAPGHNADGAPVANWDIVTLAGAGGIRSTGADMARFLRANLSQARTALHGALAKAREVRFTPPGGHRLGLGWHISPENRRWHNGQTGGYHSFGAVDVQARKACIVLSNSATGEIDRLGMDLMKMLAGEKVEPPKFEKKVAVDKKTLKGYVGSYRLAPTFVLTVTLEDGKLMVQATGQQKFRVYPESPTAFRYRVVPAKIVFEKGDGGKVTALVLHQSGREMRAPRQP